MESRNGLTSNEGIPKTNESTMKIAGYLFIVLTILLVGCNSTKDIPFSSHSWYINDITRNVESTDTTLSFTLCSDMTEREFPLIGNENEVLKYKGLR